MNQMMLRITTTVLFTFGMNGLIYADDSQTNSARVLLDKAMKHSDIMNADEVKSMLATVESKELLKGRVIENNKFRVKLLKESELNKAVLRYTAPKNVEGMAYLSHMDNEEEVNQEDAKIWLYMPALNKTKRVTLSSAQSNLPGIGDSFNQLGDLGDVENYIYKQLDDEVVEGINHYVIRITPKDSTVKPAAVRKVWINVEKELVSRLVSLDQLGEIIEETNIDNYKPYLSYWLPTNIESKNHQTKKESLLVYNEIKLNAALKGNDFNVNSLKRNF